MRIEKIIIDMDGVLVDFIGGLTKKLKPLWIVPGDTSQWDLSKYYSGDNVMANVNNILSKSEHWAKLKPIDKYAIDVLRKLNNKYSVTIASCLWMNSMEASYYGKMAWLHKHAGFLRDEQIILLRGDTKHELIGDLIIEDRPTTLEKFAGTGILFDATYNRDDSGFLRVNSWRTIGGLL